jgi:hypothetical protein
MKKMKQKDKNLTCDQYPHHVDIDFLWITCGPQTLACSSPLSPHIEFTLLQVNNLCYWAFFPVKTY